MTRIVLGSFLACVLLPACASRNTGPGAAAPHASRSEADPAAQGASTPGAETLEERQRRQVARMDGWIAVGMGSLAGVVALYTSYQMLHDKSVRDANCDSHKVCSTTGFDANSELEALSGWNVGSWAFTAAGLGVGAFLLLTNPSDASMGPRVGIGPTGSGTGLTLRSAFR